MATVLTWLHSGVGTKTGTTVAAFINDFVSVFNTYSSDPNYLWQVASSSTAGNPHWIVLKRKSGAAGRILIVIWTSAPAGNNAAILDTTPTNNAAYVAWFPNGNVDTPSNLTAASGTIMGSDTGAVKVGTWGTIATLYSAGFQPFYFDSAEAVWFGTQDPTSTTAYMSGAGDILLDGAGNAYGGTYGSNGFSLVNFANQNSAVMTYQANTVSAGASTNASVRTNYGSSNRAYFHAQVPNGWANIAIGPFDVLTDTATSKAWFVPVVLIGQTKGEGFVLRLRQVAFGPGTSGAFSAYSTTGPVVAARQFNARTTGGNGYPWFTNFDI